MKAITSFTSILIATLSVLSAGCDRLTSEESDFGASVVATHIQAARMKCEAVDAHELWACAELGKENREARLSSRIALDSYESFKSGCYEAAGMTKCEALLEKALRKGPNQ